ncbi:hypothetical protein VCHC55C2_2570B, partial [Vibrio cholerae HC-55C2]
KGREQFVAILNRVVTTLYSPKRRGIALILT